MNHLFIVGAQRSGSTYLYHLLNTHPQIVMAQPVFPEPKFFLKEELCGKGPAYYESLYFADCPQGTRYIGEKSTSYIESVTALQRIHQFYPDARILMIFRDPVLRAWSNYRFSVQHGLESLGFEAALAAEPERLREAAYATSVNPFAYRRRGYYSDYIKEYLKVFCADKLYILIFEELVGNLASVQRLYHWLGVDDRFTPPMLGEVFNLSNSSEEDHTAAFKNLALGYRQSLERLEDHLGRRIDAWRLHWEGL